MRQRIPFMQPFGNILFEAIRCFFCLLTVSSDGEILYYLCAHIGTKTPRPVVRRTGRAVLPSGFIWGLLVQRDAYRKVRHHPEDVLSVNSGLNGADLPESVARGTCKSSLKGLEFSVWLPERPSGLPTLPSGMLWGIWGIGTVAPPDWMIRAFSRAAIRVWDPGQL